MQLPCCGKVHNHFSEQFWNQTLEVLLHRLIWHLISTELTNSIVCLGNIITHICGLFQNRGVVSTSYMLRVWDTSVEHFAETLNYVPYPQNVHVACSLLTQLT